MDMAVRSFGDVGPDVVFIHGFGGDRLTWAATIPALPTARVHTVDLPGHGDTGLDADDGSVAALATGIVAGLDGRIGGPAHFVGHSLGAGLGLLIAQQRPELVQSLFLIAPAGLGHGVDGGFLEAYGAMTTRDEATALLTRLVGRPELISRQIVDYALGQLARDGVRETLATIAGGVVAGQQTMAAAAQAVAERGTARTVVWGRDDMINPPDLAQLTAFGDHTLLPGVGHLPHVEAPTAVNERLVAFIAGAV